MVEVNIEREAVANHGKRLEHFTIAWNCLEGLIAVVTGAIAGAPIVGGMMTFTIHILILAPVFFLLLKKRVLRHGTLHVTETMSPKA